MHTKISSIMISQLTTVEPNNTASKALNIFNEKRIHHIPVIDTKGKLQGIISNIDIERLKHGAGLFRNQNKESLDETLFRTLLVKDIMTSEVISLEPTDSLLDAYAIFKNSFFRAIPIVTKGELVGIVTPLDIMKFFCEGDKNEKHG